MLHQLRYKCSVKPTRRLIAMARRAFLSGEPLPRGVEISAVTWSAYPGDTRAAIAGAARRFIGKAGVVKCYGAPNRTLCDYDQEEPPTLPSMWRIAKMMHITPEWIRYDRTARGWHVVIEWTRRFRPMEIVALQFALGSDCKRETFNVARLFSRRGSRRWNLLFDYKL